MPPPRALPTRKFSEADRAAARKLFLEHTPPAKIAELVGCSVDRVADWANQGENKISWHTQREESDRGLLEDGFGRRRRINSRSADIAADQIHRGLEYLSQRDQPLTAAELERVANVQTMLQKEIRLDTGKATENLAVQATVKMSAEEIRQAILEDPFFVAAVVPPGASGPSKDVDSDS